MSYKQYEVLKISYSFDKYTRKILPYCEIRWKHLKYYKTMESALDAVRDFRRDSWIDKAYYDYPGESIEKQYPHIIPRITITRYKAIKRDIVDNEKVVSRLQKIFKFIKI